MAMRAAVFAMLATFAIASCWVSRKTSDFTCDVDTDCMGGRKCDRGYCVEEPCPGDCTSCDNNAKTCLVECTSDHHCGSVDCPDGYQCTVQCMAPNACNNVRCHDATSCTVMCSGANACDEVDCNGADACGVTCTQNGSCAGVTCGSHPCNVSCGANSACGSVDCSSSCKCDVTCPSGNCSSSCPQGATKPCTVDGTGGTACNSSNQAGCNDGC
jgi:hypothetical protein